MKRRLLLILGILVGMLVFVQQYSQIPIGRAFAQTSVKNTTDQTQPVHHRAPHFKKLRSRKIAI